MVKNENRVSREITEKHSLDHWETAISNSNSTTAWAADWQKKKKLAKDMQKGTMSDRVYLIGLEKAMSTQT